MAAGLQLSRLRAADLAGPEPTECAWALPLRLEKLGLVARCEAESDGGISPPLQRWVDRITSLLHSPSQRSREMGFALAVVTWRQASTACRHVGRVWFTASCNTVKTGRTPGLAPAIELGILALSAGAHAFGPPREVTHAFDSLVDALRTLAGKLDSDRIARHMALATLRLLVESHPNHLRTRASEIQSLALLNIGNADPAAAALAGDLLSSLCLSAAPMHRAAAWARTVTGLLDAVDAILDSFLGSLVLEPPALAPAARSEMAPLVDVGRLASVDAAVSAVHRIIGTIGHCLGPSTPHAAQLPTGRAVRVGLRLISYCAAAKPGGPVNESTRWHQRLSEAGCCLIAHVAAITGPAFTPFASRVLRSLSEVATEARTASATATVVIEASRLGRSVEVGPAKQLAQNMVVDLPRDLSQGDFRSAHEVCRLASAVDCCIRPAQMSTFVLATLRCLRHAPRGKDDARYARAVSEALLYLVDQVHSPEGLHMCRNIQAELASWARDPSDLVRTVSRRGLRAIELRHCPNTRPFNGSEASARCPSESARPGPADPPGLGVVGQPSPRREPSAGPLAQGAPLGDVPATAGPLIADRPDCDASEYPEPPAPVKTGVRAAPPSRESSESDEDMPPLYLSD